MLTACGGGGGSGSTPAPTPTTPAPEPIPSAIAVNAVDPLRTPQGEPIVGAAVVFRSLDGTELARTISSDGLSDDIPNPEATVDGSGRIQAELTADISPQTMCHVTVSGGEFVVLRGGRVLRVANDTAPEMLIPCGALDTDGAFSSNVADGGLKINAFSTAIAQTLRLYAPIEELGPDLTELLDEIAGQLPHEPSLDRNGDGVISYLEWSMAPQDMLTALDLDVLYQAIRSNAQSYLNIAPPDPPNIVVILADDIGYGDVSSFWEPGEIDTPHIDQIARNGAAFTNFHVYPVCSSTRAALLSGRFVRNMRVPGTGGPANAGIPRFVTTIPEYLRQGGYRTGAFGKWHLSNRQGFLPHHRGFREWLGFYDGASGYDFADISELNSNFFDQNDEPFNLAEGHTTDIITDRAIQFIERSTGEPFFLYLSFNAAHVPLWSQDTQQFSARPDWLEQVRADGISGERKQDYIALVRHMDARIGDVLSSLSAQDLDQKTIVIFASDNGADVSIIEDPNTPIGSNAFFRGGKGSVYEGGLRVPMAIQWPGTIPAGQEIDEFTSLIDLWPTLRDFADLPRRDDDLTSPTRGQSLLPLLAGNNTLREHDRTAYFRFGFASTIINYPWKLIRGGGSESLFNLADDPSESSVLNDLLPEKFDEMVDALNAYLADTER
jgi:arylsulfatase A-like enzyme